ncbi:MAG: AI-2E family transporter [Terriglobia bacterium]|jgi:predicted PurR-regulated permease PerM|nr:AI-2E family transporter [Terriglobia bacterium]
MPEVEHDSSPASQAPASDAEIFRTVAELERRRYSRLQAASLIVLATAAVLTLMYFAKLVLVVALVSVLLAFILAPVVDACDRAHLPRWFGSGFAILLFLGISYMAMYFSYNRAISFLDDLPKYSERMRETVIRFRQRTEKIQKTAENVLQTTNTQDDKNAIPVKVKQTNWVDSVTQGAGTVTEIVLLVGFIPFLTYFMLSWQEHFRSSTVMLFKLENRNTAYVTLGLISAMIRSFIVGNVVVGLFISLVSMTVFGALHLPYFYFLGVISGFLSLIPYLGVVLALVPPLAAGIGQIHSEQVLIIVLTVLGLHLFALNVLYPKIIGKRLQLNPLAVTLALLFWGWLWGAMGLILAVPVTAALKIIFDHVEGLRPWGAWLGE